MPVWRCPHCATPQQEASRCWVCRRSTTSCATCRHFRRGVAGGLGLCGLDRRRRALDGSEMRACWTAAPTPTDPGERTLVAMGPGRRTGHDAPSDPVPARPARTFVPVETLMGPFDEALAVGAVVGSTDRALAQASSISPAPGVPGRIPGTWWLWGDPEPSSDL